MKILSLDGGGVFGKAQAQLLADAGCMGKFDCFVGTSIGSANAAAYAYGFDPREMVSFFDDWMPTVFDRSWWRKFNPFVSKYPDDGLNEATQDVFGSLTLGEVKRPLFMTAADVGGRTLKVFGSPNFDDARLYAWETARRCTAAETYFDSWKGFADGGVFANNPAMVAVAAASKVLGVPLQEMEILSIGTGRSTTEGNNNPKSVFQWGAWLVDAMLTGASDDMHDYFVRSLPVKKYVRIQFLREKGWKLDSVDDMNAAMEKWAPEIQAGAEVARDF